MVTESLVTIYVLVWIIPSMIIAGAKNKSLIKAFFASLLFGIFALIYYIFASPQEPAKRKFSCNNCGSNVSESSSFCPECGAEFEEDEIECSDCGTINDEGNKFCSKCGSDLTETNNEDKKKQSKSKKDDEVSGQINTKAIIIVLAILFVLILVVVIATSFSSNKEAVECNYDYCSGRQFIQCSNTSDGSNKKINQGKIIGKCGIECFNVSDCNKEDKCVNYQCCSDECQESRCVDTYYFQNCLTIDGCTKYTDKSLVIGKCGVECQTSIDCNLGFRCNSSYNCVDYDFNKKIRSGTFEWIFKNMWKAESLSSGYLSSEAKGVYLVLNVEVVNIGSEPAYLDSSFVTLVDSADRTFSPESSVWWDNELSFDTLNPGIVKKGDIIFDVPENINVVNIRVSSNLVEDSFKTLRKIV